MASLVKTAETMGLLDATSEKRKKEDIDEILGFLAALEKVRKPVAPFLWTMQSTDKGGGRHTCLATQFSFKRCTLSIG